MKKILYRLNARAGGLLLAVGLVLAGSAVGIFLGRARFPLRVTTQGGFELEVADLPGWRWSLAGDARVVAEGELLAGALASPAPPPWAATGVPLA